MSLKDKIKKINDYNFKDRFFPDYVINKTIFRVSIIICFLIMFAVLSQYGFDFDSKLYIVCPLEGGQPCNNPYYMEENSSYFYSFDCPDPKLCEIETFYAGDSYGEKPPFIFKAYGYIVFLIFIVALTINHLKYNRGKK